MAGWQQCNRCKEFDYVDWPNGHCGKCKKELQSNSNEKYLSKNESNLAEQDFEMLFKAFAQDFSADYSLNSILSGTDLFEHSKAIAGYAQDPLKIIYHSQIVIYEILHIFINEKEQDYKNITKENLEDINEFFMTAASIIIGYASRICLMEEELLKTNPFRKNVNVYGLVLSAIDLLPKSYREDVIQVYVQYLSSIGEKTLTQSYESGAYKFIPVRVDDIPLKNYSHQERIQVFLNHFYTGNLKLDCYHKNSRTYL